MKLDELRRLAASPDIQDRIKALGWLEQCDDVQALEIIKKATYDSEPGVRFLARKALKRLSELLNVDASEIKVDQESLLKQVYTGLELGDEKQKLAACRKLRNIPYLNNIVPLHRCLENETETPVILALLDTAAAFDPPEDSAWLKRFLYHREQEVQVAAIRIAERMYPGAFLEDFRRLMDSGNPTLVVETAAILAGTDRIKVFDVIKGLVRDPSPFMRIKGVEALGRVGTMEARNLLNKILNDKDMDVRIKASLVVAEVDLKIARELETAIPDTPEEGQEVSKERLKEILHEQRQAQEEKQQRQREAAQQARKALEVTVIPPEKRGNLEFWKEKLTDSDYQVRLQVVQEAGVEKMAALLPFLQDRLQQEDSKYVIASLVKVVAALGGSRVVEDIKPFLKHADGRVRANTVEALGSIGIKDVFDLLLPLLNDEVGRVRANTVQVLWSFSPKKVIQKLETMVESPEIWERSSAIYTLERIPFPQVLPLVKKMLRDNNTDIKVRAAELFATIESGEGAKEGAWEPGADADEFDEVEAELMNLTHQDYRRRVNAALALADIGSGAIVPRLSNLLKLEKNEYVIATLVKTLGKLGREQAVEVLEPYLKHTDNRVRANTVEAIEMTGSPQRFSLLSACLRDSDGRVRANAVKALWKISPQQTRKLVETMLASNKLSQRLLAVNCLEVVRTPVALARLETLSKSPAREVAAAAEASLRRARTGSDTVPVTEEDAIAMEMTEEVMEEHPDALHAGSDWGKLKQVISENIVKLGSAKPTEVFGAQSVLQELVDEATLPYVEEILERETNPQIVLSLLKFVEIREGEKAVYRAVPYLDDKRADMKRSARDIVMKHDKLEINTLLVNDLKSGDKKLERRALKALCFTLLSRFKKRLGLMRA